MKPRLRVLIADDTQETRRSTRLMLSTNPMVTVVAIAQNGRQALELARQQRPDIAIVDINMPEMDGLSAIQHMMQAQPELCCIVISAERESDMLRKAMSVGAREYLVKPFTIEELEQAIERMSRLVFANQRRMDEVTQQRAQYELNLKRLAEEYIKSRRTDNQAVEVFERLAANPDCELRWLVALGMVYMFRQEWSKLKALAERLERRSQQPPGQPSR
ncbi:MAG: response regulator [Anaerolineales bacterium]|nr:response regulator [Anaerolineales bacterium]